MSIFGYKEDSANAQMPGATSGAKLTEKKTTKPVEKPVTDNIKETNQRMEVLEKRLNDVTDALKVIIEMEKRKYPNWIDIIDLSNTSITQLKFGVDTNNSPILKVEVMAVGAGLFISLNGCDLFSATVGDVYEGEFQTIQYNVTGGTAYIKVYARIDK